MTWVEEHINNEAVFPSSPGKDDYILFRIIIPTIETDIIFILLESVDVPFPRNYMTVVKSIFTRMFRIFAIIYTHHFSKLEELGAVIHLNTSFKHYLFFIWEFDLVESREIDALRDIAGELRQVYIAQGPGGGH
jgi:hypothetical protein